MVIRGYRKYHLMKNEVKDYNLGTNYTFKYTKCVKEKLSKKNRSVLISVNKPCHHNEIGHMSDRQTKQHTTMRQRSKYQDH